MRRWLMPAGDDAAQPFQPAKNLRRLESSSEIGM